MIKQSYFYSFVLALGYIYNRIYSTGIARSRERDIHFYRRLSYRLYALSRVV